MSLVCKALAGSTDFMSFGVLRSGVSVVLAFIMVAAIGVAANRVP